MAVVSLAASLAAGSPSTAPFAEFQPEPSINTFFPYIRVITLPKRSRYVHETFGVRKIEYVTFPAVLGSSLNTDVLIRQGVLAPDHIFQSKNEIACTLSHLHVLEEFVMDPSHQRILIFEDDVAFDPASGPDGGAVDRMKLVMDGMPGDWEFINFGRCFDNCNKDFPVSDYVSISDNALCAHSYAVTKEGAKKILKTAYPIRVPIDVYYLNLMKLPRDGLKFYTSTPRVFNQRRGVSIRDITDSTLGHMDSCPECNEDISSRKHIFFWVIGIVSAGLLYLALKGR